MSHPTESSTCGAPGVAVDPFLAPRYHFGMLLGVEELDLEHAYHRSKSRLHNAWLHGDGVVWGLAAEPRDGADPAALRAGEVRIAPGLALDATGRELYLDAPVCVSLPTWFERHRDDAALRDVTRATPTGGVVFDAHIAMRFRSCLTREVPALVEPCAGSMADTAFSREVETVRLDLVAGPAPARLAPYPHLRSLFGLETPGPHDPVVAAALAAVRTAAPSARAHAWQSALRSLAARDAALRSPARDPDGTRHGLFPAGDDVAVVLCELRDVTLEPDAAGRLQLVALRVDESARTSLIAASAVQELVLALVAAQTPDASAPRILDAALIDSATLQLTASAPLAAATLAGAIHVASHAADPAAGWIEHTVTASIDPVDRRQVRLAVAPPIADRALVRIVARATGPTPILGEDLVPITGNSAGPTGGGDHVVTLRRI